MQIRLARRCDVLAAGIGCGTRGVRRRGLDDTAEPSIDNRVEAAEADGDEPRRQLVKWNQYEGPFITARLGGGFLYDFAAYGQDATSKDQLTLGPKDGLRDFRVLLKGNFPQIPRLSYTLGYMYDGAIKEWRFRQTGLMIEVPELWGDFFVGRTKEGFSTNKIMVGYQGWTQERATANDAFIPILADGIKWSGYVPNGKLVYNLGFFRDDLSETESFNKNDNQAVGRVVFLPFGGKDPTVLHLALDLRYGQSDDGFLRYRSKPESFLAQDYVIDTGEFSGLAFEHARSRNVLPARPSDVRHGIFPQSGCFGSDPRS